MTEALTAAEITSDTLIRGYEWREFYQKRWPKEWYIDDVAIDFEDERGNYVLPDDGAYRLGDFGYACWQGPEGRPHAMGTMFPIHELYARVMGRNDTTCVVAFRVEKDQLEALRSAAADLGAAEV